MTEQRTRDEIDAKLARKRVGDDITVIDAKGARFVGVLQENRPGVDEPDEVVIRRPRQVVRLHRDRIRDVL